MNFAESIVPFKKLSPFIRKLDVLQTTFNSQNSFHLALNSNYGLARFRVVASQIWEAIPIEVKNLPFKAFKKEYKRLLLDDQ